MKNKCKILVVLTFVIVFLFYRVDSVVAIANEHIEPTMAPESEDSTENVAESETEPTAEPAPDYISTGPALIEWLESHKSTGGLAKLTDNVVLNGYYAYCPYGINMPPVFIDTDKYTITIAGDIEILSDNHLTFSGQPAGKGIFYVAPKGVLSISGVAVESGQCALWQEEGAGLVIDDCHISGDIHYADTPFVIRNSSAGVIVEKGQTVNDVLPTQIGCSVNRRGDVSYNELLPVSWMLEGTEKQQEERLRFKVQGSFLYAASFDTLFCTVVYNDYPLTFTDMKASLSYNAYLFLGGYTKPEECLPITVTSEYSFDGENWLMYEEKVVSNVHESFVLCLEAEKWDTAAYPDIYIRQQWNDNGTIHFSNVLRYAADNLECEHDIGGSRGGGTSITNPPAEPQKSTGGQSSNTGTQNTNADQSSNSGTQNVDSGMSSNTGSQNADTGQSSYSESKSANAGKPAYSESGTDNSVIIANAPDNKESINNSDSNNYEKSEETAAVLSAYEENSGNIHSITEHTMRSDTGRGNGIVIAIGCVVLSVIAGIVGFRAHVSLSGTNR